MREGEHEEMDMENVKKEEEKGGGGGKIEEGMRRPREGRSSREGEHLPCFI